jgi:hypothetical protein
MKKQILCFSFMLGLVCQMIFCSTLSAQGITLIKDTVDLIPGIPKSVNLLANDIIPAGDSIRIYVNTGQGGVTIYGIPGSVIAFIVYYWGVDVPVSTGSYTVHDYTLDTTVAASILFRVRDKSYDSLYLNNINARINVHGNHFGGFRKDHGSFEVPKFGGKSTIYTSSVWIGGLDQDSVLHLAGQTYGQGPTGGTAMTKSDFWAGPVMNTSAYSIYQDTVWNRIWNLYRWQIDYHKTHWRDAGYQPAPDILTWPGNGNLSLGQAAKLAPFFDRNNDGIYNPMDGDYPLIRGDQALYFIFNDARNVHTETQGNPLNVEIHGMAYAFDLPNDSAFNNTLFLNYKIINRSDKIYYNTYLGVFTDLDIGYATDDYIGCNVERSYYYGYNGDSIDGFGQSWAYGTHPPAQSVTILGGPRMDPDDLDNPRVDNHGHPLCNESVSGIYFGDSIVDNERLGMSHFYYFNNDNTVVGNPTNASDYYYYMSEFFHIPFDTISYRFMLPGVSDTLNWGSDCFPVPLYHATESDFEHSPGDRRGISSSGPFTFAPGQEQELDLCYTFARDYQGNGSLGILQDRTDTIRKYFITNSLPNGWSFNGISQITNTSALEAQLFPNPASSTVNIRFNRMVNDPVTIRIFNSSGSMIQSETGLPSGKLVTLSLTGLSSGLYFITIEVKGQTMTKKMSVIK